MWEGLDTIEWAALRHSYGSADDLPEVLRACAGPDAEAAEEAAWDLYNKVFHQGGWICSAAPAVLPFALRLAAAQDIAPPVRRSVLDLLDALAREAPTVGAGIDPEWWPAWDRALPALVALLDDPLAEIRLDVSRALRHSDTPGAHLLPALLRRWSAEDHPAVRLDLLLTVGAAARRAPAGPHATEANDLLRALLADGDLQTRHGAVHALAPTDPELPCRYIELLAEALRDPDVERWHGTEANGRSLSALYGWTTNLFSGPGPATAFVRTLFDDSPEATRSDVARPDPARRDAAPQAVVRQAVVRQVAVRQVGGRQVGGRPGVAHRAAVLDRAGTLLDRWHSPVEALLPAIADRLDDPAPAVRGRAAELLACLGPAGAAHADRLAALLDDDAVPFDRDEGTVAEYAVWALARIGDPRCVPGLVAALAGPRTGFGSFAMHVGALAGLHSAELPGLHEVVATVPAFAAALMEGVERRLAGAREQATVHQFGEVLVGWRSASGPAVARLTELLGDDPAWPAAAAALAELGPAVLGDAAAETARKALTVRAAEGEQQAEVAAWAQWRLGGDPEPAVAALGAVLAASGSFRHPALRRLGDLGPHAAGLADQLRLHIGDADLWTRVEAARALWTATGDTERAVPALVSALGDLDRGRPLPVMPIAIRHLIRIGPAAVASAAPLLRAALADDARLRSAGAWRGYVQDETLRGAAAEALALL